MNPQTPPPTEKGTEGLCEDQIMSGYGYKTKTIYPAGESNPFLRSRAYSLVIILTDLDSGRLQK